MPHEKIYLLEPDYATPEAKDAAGLWVPKGAMFQWGPYGEGDGSAAVGLGIGNFGETPEDRERVESGQGTQQDMFMLWFNRSQLNAIIRTARRARNAAYGTDE
jgi:hypothetical protein